MNSTEMRNCARCCEDLLHHNAGLGIQRAERLISAEPATGRQRANDAMRCFHAADS